MTTDDEPLRTLEIERKYDADAETPLPDWSAAPGIAAVTGPEERPMDARYIDTADGALSRAGVALRRRTGGPDAGWHIKGPRRGDARVELTWPLGDDDDIPQAVMAAAAEWAAPPYLPIARIESVRLAFHLQAPGGGVVAEFVDDAVHARDERTGTERSWREWEIELGPAAPADPAGRDALFAAIERAIFVAGARPATSDSKLARALGA